MYQTATSTFLLWNILGMYWRYKSSMVPIWYIQYKCTGYVPSVLAVHFQYTECNKLEPCWICTSSTCPVRFIPEKYWWYKSSMVPIWYISSILNVTNWNHTGFVPPVWIWYTDQLVYAEIVLKMFSAWIWYISSTVPICYKISTDQKYTSSIQNFYFSVHFQYKSSIPSFGKGGVAIGKALVCLSVL